MITKTQIKISLDNLPEKVTVNHLFDSVEILEFYPHLIPIKTTF